MLADALRSDRHKFKRLSIPDATTLALREVSRCYDTLKVDLLQLANRLRGQLQRYFPQLLELCPAANEPWFWELLELAADHREPRAGRRAQAPHAPRATRSRAPKSPSGGYPYWNICATTVASPSRWGRRRVV